MREDSGEPHPAELRKPELRDDCLDYYTLYTQIGTKRQWLESGPQPLQPTEIKAHLELLGLTDPEEVAKCYRLIGRMDVVELNYHSAERARGNR